MMLDKASPDPAWLGQGEGEYGHRYLREILQKHFPAVLVKGFAISDAE